MLWIGLTGGLGTGKTTAGQILVELGASVVNADQVAHGALKSDSPFFKDLVQHFGPDILVQGEIDRSLLGKKVFQNEEELRFLESKVHPFVQQKVREKREELEQSAVSVAFYDVPLLFEKKLELQFDQILLIYSPLEMQMERVRNRNQWSDEEIKRRLAQQMNIEDKRPLSHYVIENTGTLDELRKELQKYLGSVTHSSKP